MRRTFLATALLALVTALSAPALRAGDEKAVELRQNETIQTFLADRAGQPVSLLLVSGQEVAGVVVSVGDGMVHLGKLSGREYYDAALRLDSIAGVIVRARGK